MTRTSYRTNTQGFSRAAGGSGQQYGRLGLMACVWLWAWSAACGDDDVTSGHPDDDGGIDACVLPPGAGSHANAGSAARAGSGGRDGTAGSGQAGSAGTAGDGSVAPPDGGAPDDDASCGPIDDEDDAGEPEPVAFSAMEVGIYRTLSPLPDVPSDPTNLYADNAAAAELGQMLFYDTSYSGPLAMDSDLGQMNQTGKIACFSCHSGPYLDDQRSQPRTVSVGAGFHTRNAPTTINSAFYRWTNWGGRFSAPWELPPAVAESPVIMNSNRLRIAHTIFDKYKSEYEAVFGALEPAIGTDLVRFPLDAKPNDSGAWATVADADRVIVTRILANFGKALEAYMRKLVSRNAPFDVFVAGDENALTESEKRGLQVFLGKGRCVNCHSGPHFSDGLFHNIGVPQEGERVPASDDGRFKDILPLLASPLNSVSVYSDNVTTGRLAGLTNPPPEATRGQFRTPSLRGVALTAPYMHSGQFATLERVVDFYDHGGRTPVAGSLDPLMLPLLLSPREKADLIAFLGTLKGEPVPAELLEDTAAD